MKNIWQVITLLLAIALVVLSLRIAMNKNTETTQMEPKTINQEEIIIENIMTRSSVRSYTDAAVENKKVDVLLRAGMAAPTAGNKQPWELMVITDRAVLDSIPLIIKGAHMAEKAPLVIAVLGSPEQALMPEYMVQDCSAVTQNILLAAHGMGLGAVWCGAFPENGSGRVESMAKLLNLPEDVFAFSVIVIGYPDSEPSPKDKWNPVKVHYNQY